jgi:hypothetical protein
MQTAIFKANEFLHLSEASKTTSSETPAPSNSTAAANDAALAQLQAQLQGIM